ncbi:MAG: DNA alkylation repair protein, partial [Verrucomicrobiota bacterium]
LSEKVFKLGEGDYELKSRTWEAKQSFRDLTTRKHYPGIHKLWIAANGKRMGELSFTVARHA